jgi:hypothetical protein
VEAGGSGVGAVMGSELGRKRMEEEESKRKKEEEKERDRGGPHL